MTAIPQDDFDQFQKDMTGVTQAIKHLDRSTGGAATPLEESKDLDCKGRGGEKTQADKRLEDEIAAKDGKVQGDRLIMG
ncbi:unnamed protein product [Merluccius merluccius]